MFFWLRKAAKSIQAQKAGVPADRAGDEFASRCRELGVEDALSEVAGISPPMLVALGENGIKTVEDLAGCATDDLYGWVEQTSDTTTRHAGVRALTRRVRGHHHESPRSGRLDRREVVPRRRHADSQSAAKGRVTGLDRCASQSTP